MNAVTRQVPRHAPPAGAGRPVFVDESGRRARWAHRGLRVLVLLCIAGVAVVLASLIGGVPLPGLSGPVALPSDEPAHPRSARPTPLRTLAAPPGPALPAGAGGPRSGPSAAAGLAGSRSSVGAGPSSAAPTGAATGPGAVAGSSAAASSAASSATPSHGRPSSPAPGSSTTAAHGRPSAKPSGTRVPPGSTKTPGGAASRTPTRGPKNATSTAPAP